MAPVFEISRPKSSSNRKSWKSVGDSLKNPNENLPEVIAEKLNYKYSVLERDTMKYIVNPQKKVVSNGYHEFQIFKHEGIMGLIGKAGSMSKVLKVPETEEGFFEESPMRSKCFIFFERGEK